MLDVRRSIMENIGGRFGLRVSEEDFATSGKIGAYLSASLAKWDLQEADSDFPTSFDKTLQAFEEDREELKRQIEEWMNNTSDKLVALALSATLHDRAWDEVDALWDSDDALPHLFGRRSEEIMRQYDEMVAQLAVVARDSSV